MKDRQERMISDKKGSPERSKGGFRGRKLNPAFAAAHGIDVNEHGSPVASPGKKRNDSSTPPRARSLGRAIDTARKTGKLVAVDLDLKTPLPEECFDLRKGLQATVSFDGGAAVIGEESLTVVDLSDNDLSSRDGDSVLDERIEVYRSLRNFRAKRCNLTHLPMDAIGKLSHLRVLDLSGNKISQVLPLTALPATLKELDVSSNEIPSLFYASCASIDGLLPHLLRLDVRNNFLSSLLPSCLSENTKAFANLQTLSFGYNKIQGDIQLHKMLVNPMTLKTLEGPHNMISVAPNLSQFHSLTVVDLCDNRLREVPIVHKSLARLSLSNNRIECSLSSLFINEESDSCLADTFRSDLVELRVRSNQISSLDEAVFRSMTKLKFLDIACNNLRDIPYVLGYLPNLHRVVLEGNALRTIRPSFAKDTDALKRSLRMKGPTPPGADYLPSDHPKNQSDARTGASAGAVAGSSSIWTAGRPHTLNLSGKNLEGVPTCVLEELRRTVKGQGAPSAGKTVSVERKGDLIKTCNIRKNSFQVLDEEVIRLLRNASNLDAGENKLTSLPAELLHLPIASLTLDKNQLTSESIALCFPFKQPIEERPYLRYLTNLNLSSNRLTSIPPGLFLLPSLSTLILSYNRISTLCVDKEEDASQPACSPPSGWLPGLPRLEYLDLSNNKIDNLGDMPVTVGGCCPKLRTLLLQNNELRAIPPELGLLSPELRSIDLRGNPQRAIRPTVLERRCEAIMSYLRGRLDEGRIEEVRRKQKQTMDCTVDAKMSKNSDAAESQEEGKNPKSDPSSSAESRPSENSPEIVELQESIERLTAELDEPQLSQAKRYALKKSLAMQRAKLLRLERQISKR